MRGQTARRWTGRARQVPGSPGLGSEAELRAAYAAHGAELYRFALRQLGDEGGALRTSCRRCSCGRGGGRTPSIRRW